MTAPPLLGHEFDLPLDDHALRVRTLRHDDTPGPLVGPPRTTLVFLHDSLGSIGTWRDFPERLAVATGCDALLYDRRGYGASSPFAMDRRTPRYLEREGEVFARVLEACDVGRAIPFGHSDGGSIALVTAARHPARIAALVVEGAHVFVEDTTLAGIRDARERLRTTDLRARLARRHGDRVDGVTSAWIDTWLDPSFRDWNIEHLLPAIHCPTLVLQGEGDEFGTAAQVEAIARGVGGAAETWLVPDTAHTPHRQAADAVLERCTAFVRSQL